MSDDVDDKARKRIHDEIAAIIAGNRLADGWAALTDYMSAVIGFSADSKAHALELCDAVVKDFKANQEKHFEFYHAQRGQFPDVAGGSA